MSNVYRASDWAEAKRAALRFVALQRDRERSAIQDSSATAETRMVAASRPDGAALVYELSPDDGDLVTVTISPLPGPAPAFALYLVTDGADGFIPVGWNGDDADLM